MSLRRIHDLAPEHVRRFEPYAPNRPDRELMRLYGVERLWRLNNNENALGPPPAAARVIRDFPPLDAAKYPHGDCLDLRQALAARFGKAPDRFLVGNGSCEVIASVIKAFCEPGDNIVTADKTFAVYEWVARFSGVEPRLAPLKDWGFDPEGLAAAVDDRTKIVFLCNPNNPTGSCWDRDTLSAFLRRMRGRCLVVLDEAYFEFVDRPGHPDGMEMLDHHPHLAVFRTFSKMYGLAALRVGWLCASSEAADMVRRTHVAYSVNALGQAAALAAVLDDREHIEATRRMVEQARSRVTGLFRDLGLPFVSGEGNYVMVRAPMPDTLLHRRLMRRGVMVRTMTGFRFPNWVRVSLAGPEAMEAFCRAFAASLEEREP